MGTLVTPITLLHLDNDILTLIVDRFLGKDSLDALYVSLVCQRLRTISLSLIFRNVSWPRRNRLEFYPSPLWPYIRQLSFVQAQWGSHHTKSLETLSRVLHHLPNLLTFTYRPQGFPPTPTFISSLAASPASASLIALELNTAFFSHDAIHIFSTFTGLRRLSVNQTERTTLLSAPESKRALSVQCVSNMVFASRTTLNHLELPGEYCPLESFASGEAKFSALKTLILHGYPPLEADRFPMWTVMRSMPHLSTLEIRYRLRVIGARLPRFTLVPKDVELAAGELSVFPSQLETLKISNPSLRDRIFIYLPPSLSSLSLDFIPYWENMRLSKDSLAYHRPGEMLGFLSRMLRLNGPCGITTLCIKMGWCATPEILDRVCHIFPYVNVLEFQGLRYVERGTSSYSDMDACVARLAELKHIHTLKLAMELPEDTHEYTHEYSPRTVRKVGSIEQAAQRWANALALRLPSLRLLGFEMRPHTGRGRGLGPRILLGQSNWVWFDIKNNVAASRGTPDIERLPNSDLEAEMPLIWK